MIIRNVMLLAVGSLTLSAPRAAAEVRARAIGEHEMTGGARAVIVESDAAIVHTAQVFPRLNSRAIETNATSQVAVVLEDLNSLLKGVGSKREEVVKLNVYLAQEELLPEVRKAISTGWGTNARPAVSYVVGTLADSKVLVGMDAVATCLPLGPAAMRRSVRDSNGFIGAKVVVGGAPKLYVSGMADPDKLLPATRKTLEKLVTTLSEFGAKPDDVLHLKVFMQPMSEAAAVRRAIAEFFNGQPPPISLVEWVSANPVVEIELVALANVDCSSEPRTVSYLTPTGATASKVYSKVARVNHGKLIYFPGLYGAEASDGAAQIQEIFATLSDTAQQAGTDFEHLVKATYYVTDQDAGTQLNKLRPKYYDPQRPPAASKATVKSVGLPGKTVMMDMIAVTK